MSKQTAYRIPNPMLPSRRDDCSFFSARRTQTFTTQRIVTVGAGARAPRTLAWLRYENHNGANVYVAANPLRSGSRKRTKDCIAEVRHLYLDIDVDGEEQSRCAYGLRKPCPFRARDLLDIARTSIKCCGGSKASTSTSRRNTLKLLAIAFGGDSACTDRNRVLQSTGIPQLQIRSRSPGFTVEYLSESIYRPDGLPVG